VLSAFPIKNVREVAFEAFLINRVNIHANIKDIKFGFDHFAFNILEDIDTGLTPLMYGLYRGIM
jgi:hypothetical protein